MTVPTLIFVPVKLCALKRLVFVCLAMAPNGYWILHDLVREERRTVSLDPCAKETGGTYLGNDIGSYLTIARLINPL